MSLDDRLYAAGYNVAALRETLKAEGWALASPETIAAIRLSADDSIGTPELRSARAHVRAWLIAATRSAPEASDGR